MPTRGMVEVSPKVYRRMTPFWQLHPNWPLQGAIPTKCYTFSTFSVWTLCQWSLTLWCEGF